MAGWGEDRIVLPLNELVRERKELKHKNTKYLHVYWITWMHLMQITALVKTIFDAYFNINK